MGRSILILGVSELNPWLQQDQVADESLQFKGEGRGPGPGEALRTIPLVAFLQPTTHHLPNFLHAPHTQKKTHHSWGPSVKHEPVGEHLKVKHTSYTEGVPGLCMLQGYTTRFFCLLWFC